MKNIFLLLLFFISTHLKAEEIVAYLGILEGDLVSASLDSRKNNPPNTLYAYPISENITSLIKPIKLQLIKKSTEPAYYYLQYYFDGKRIDETMGTKVLYKPNEKLTSQSYILSNFSNPLKIRVVEEDSYYKDTSAYDDKKKKPSQALGYYLVFLNNEQPYDLKTKKSKTYQYVTDQNKLMWKYISPVISTEGEHAYIQTYKDNHCVAVTDFSHYVGYDMEMDPPEEFDRATCSTSEYCILLADSKLFAQGSFVDNNTCAEMCDQVQKKSPSLTGKKILKFECKKVTKDEDPLKNGKPVKKDLDPEANKILDDVASEMKEYETAVTKKDEKKISLLTFQLSVQFDYLRRLLPEVGILSGSTKIKILELSKNERFMKIAVETKTQQLIGYIKGTVIQIDTQKNTLGEGWLMARKSELSEYLQTLRQLLELYKAFITPESIKQSEKILSDSSIRERL